MAQGARGARRRSVDGGHLVQAVLFSLQSQIGDAVGHVDSLGRVVVGARRRVGCHCARRKGQRLGFKRGFFVVVWQSML